MAFQPIQDTEVDRVKKLFKGKVTAREVSLKLKVTPRRAHKILDRAGYHVVTKGGQGVQRVYSRRG